MKIPPVSIKTHRREILFPRRPLLMGIVNVNDDSFCGDGSLNMEEIRQQITKAISAGADVIDVGAESARTNREPISEEEEIRRLTPVMQHWDAWVADITRRDEEQLSPLLSINTWRPEVVKEVCEFESVELVNDMGGLPTDANARACAEVGKALLIMHTTAPPKVRQTGQYYDDVVGELGVFFEEKMALAELAGLEKSQIILDPGIDFAKQCDDNLRLLKGLQYFTQKGYPCLVPISRKTVIKDVLGVEAPLERDPGTWALLAQSVQCGAHLLRVHNVDEAFNVNKVLAAIR